MSAEQHLQRFWDSVEHMDPASCWPWTSALDVYGYGRFQLARPHRRILKAHRVIYELTRGTIPQGLDLDHLCRNHACCNPDHLEPVTRAENTLRGIAPTALNARKTECVHGHEFNAANTYFYLGGKDKDRLRRGCRVCNRQIVARRNARLRGSRVDEQAAS